MKEKIDLINQKIQSSKKIKEIEENNKKHDHYSDHAVNTALLLVFCLYPLIVTLFVYKNIIFLTIYIIILLIHIVMGYMANNVYVYRSTEDEKTKIFFSIIKKDELENLVDYLIEENKEKFNPQFPIDLHYDFENKEFKYNDELVKKMYDEFKPIFYDTFKSVGFLLFHGSLSEFIKNIAINKLELIIKEGITKKENYNLIVPKLTEPFIVDCVKKINVLIDADETILKENERYIIAGSNYFEKNKNIDNLPYPDPFTYENIFLKYNYYEKTKELLKPYINDKTAKEKELIDTLIYKIGKDLCAHYGFVAIHRIITLKPVIIDDGTYNNHCWNCHSSISSLKNKRCGYCGWYICNKCGACSTHSHNHK